jgi:medium-chain acyl-[acyl-carrier-protein] hydrolase
MTSADRSLYLSYRPDPFERIRLFCFPNAGGGVSTLHNWLRQMPAGIHVCPIQLPGRENRRTEAPFTQLSLLAPMLADALEPEINVQYALFGHSLGAIVAFEVARELRRRGAPLPRHLFVAARKAPSLSDPVLKVGEMPEAQLIASLTSRYNAIPEAILADKELLALFMPVLRADLEMMETYEFIDGDPLDCPISAFGGLEDAGNPQAQIERWRSFTTAAFSLRMYPGGHFFPRTSQQAFAAAIGRDLAPYIA